MRENVRKLPQCRLGDIRECSNVLQSVRIGSVRLVEAGPEYVWEV